MAKKKPVASPEGPIKSRFEFRFDPEVGEGIKRIADAAQISVNQLMQGLARWVVQSGHAGEPSWDEEGILRTKSQAGCVWMGREGWKLEDLDPEVLGPEYFEIQERYQGPVKGKLELFLDFTERRVIREDVVKRKA